MKICFSSYLYVQRFDMVFLTLKYLTYFVRKQDTQVENYEHQKKEVDDKKKLLINQNPETGYVILKLC